MPLKEVMLYYERKYNIQIEEILIGSARIYSNIIKSKKQKERLDQNISIINKEFNQDGQIILYISGNDIEYQKSNNKTTATKDLRMCTQN